MCNDRREPQNQDCGGWTRGAAAGGLLAATFGGNATGIAAGTILGGLVGGLGIAWMLRIRNGYIRARNRPWRVHQRARQLPGVIRTLDTLERWCPRVPTKLRVACREFQQTVTIDGQQQNAYGTACRQPDGSWKIVN